jgi:uncharacterized membrane protein
MTVSVPLVAILGALVYVIWRYMGLRVWHAVVCACCLDSFSPRQRPRRRFVDW